jgi:hypothetical protein
VRLRVAAMLPNILQWLLLPGPSIIDCGGECGIGLSLQSGDHSIDVSLWPVLTQFRLSSYSGDSQFNPNDCAQLSRDEGRRRDCGPGQTNDVLNRMFSRFYFNRASGIVEARRGRSGGTCLFRLAALQPLRRRGPV